MGTRKVCVLSPSTRSLRYGSATKLPLNSSTTWLRSDERTMATRNTKRWSQRVTESSNALDLEQGVFSKGDPRAIARSLKRSADRSRRRKSDPFRSAMSMLNFYINRAGKNLSKTRRHRLEIAKDELRDLYGRGLVKRHV